MEPVPVPAPAKPKSPLAGVNVMLMGPTGTGKTHSIGTAIDAMALAAPHSKIAYLGLEPGLESLLGYYTDRGKPIPDNLAWHTLAGPAASLTEMSAAATSINTFSLDALSKQVDPNRGKYNQFVGLLTALNDFPDDRNPGTKLGAVNNWGTDRMLVIDGLTGLCRAAMALVVGGKAVKSQSDWGIAQDQVEKLVRMLCDNCRCHFTLLAHVERETDQVLGGVKLMPSALGKALPPKLPPMFSDAILTVRNMATWQWDTASALADVKTRNLPIKSDNAPNFATILSKWQSRGGVYENG